MKNLLFTSILILFPLITIAQETITVTGQIINDNTEGLVGSTVMVKNTNNSVITDMDGNFRLPNVPANGILLVKAIGYEEKEISVEGRTNINIAFATTTKTTSVSTSEKHYWVGAKIGYNFVGDTDDNFFVGSASLEINLLDLDSDEHSFGVLGNIGNFKFDKETDSSEDIQKIAQSINGISIGLGYTHDSGSVFGLEKMFNEKSKLIFRQFLQTGIRMTSFSNIGEEDETVNLAQSVTTAGLELELFGFKKGGALSLSSGVSLYLFDKDKYQQIFDEERRSIIGIDFTLIVPISKNIGFFTNGTFARSSSASYILGVIYRPEPTSKDDEKS